jgi:hypothetical protein
MRKLSAAEYSAQDRVKTTLHAALRQCFSSAPGYKDGYQDQEDHDHSDGHIREDQVRHACGKRQSDEWSYKNNQ